MTFRKVGFEEMRFQQIEFCEMNFQEVKFIELEFGATEEDDEKFLSPPNWYSSSVR